MGTFIDLFVNLDQHLAELAQAYGPWIYGALFVIVFAETGLVVTPLLPGDSLLFAIGALGAIGALDVRVAAGVAAAAAITGDAVNYAAGRFVGPRVFCVTASHRVWERLLNPRHLHRGHEFFERYGGKAVVLGRFVPVVRTFVPFVAGAVSMTYPRFAFYNVVGGLLWVGICVPAGYAFGNVPFVERHFSAVALGIVAVSMLPLLIELLRGARTTRRPVLIAAENEQGRP